MHKGLKFALYIGLCLLSSSLFALSWPYVGNQTYLIFFAFLPILYVERVLSESTPRFLSLKIFAYSYLTFFVFNYWTTWWIELASPGGMWLAVGFNSLFMALVFLLFHWTRKVTNNKVGYWALVIYWLAFEYLHINWELSWMWLTFGNVFANDITWIQWYEHTGILGGSLWILLSNALAFTITISLIKGRELGIRKWSWTLLLLVLIVLPIVLSNYRYHHYVEKTDPVEVVVLQPNIDPYRDKFNGMPEEEQIDRLIQLSEEKVGHNTELIFAPETAFPLSYWEHKLEDIYGTIETRKFLKKNPQVKFVVGLSTLGLYESQHTKSKTARSLNDMSGAYFDYFNSVIQIEDSEPIKIYRKSKLVLGVERMPFTGQIKLFESLAIELGGATGSLGTEKSPLVFESSATDGRKLSVAPAICYESIYGEYITEFVQKGANLIGIVTNDGWWGNTPGYWQHLSYSKLRAIETRRSIARSANTGISAFLNQRGDILVQSTWWTEDALKGSINLNDELTFYVRHGDYPGRIAAFFAVLLLVYALVKRLKRPSSVKASLQ